MANMAVSRIKREFKEVINSEEVGTKQTIIFLFQCVRYLALRDLMKCCLFDLDIEEDFVFVIFLVMIMCLHR